MDITAKPNQQHEKKSMYIYISEEECQINISQEWLRIIFLFDMMPLVFILFLVGG